jgi:hypothetical protein
MFADKPPALSEPKNYSDLKNSKTPRIETLYDATIEDVQSQSFGWLGFARSRNRERDGDDQHGRK